MEDKLPALLRKYLEDSLTAAETAELIRLLPNADLPDSLPADLFALSPLLNSEKEWDRETMFRELTTRMNNDSSQQPAPAKIVFLRRKFQYAAAIILLVLAGTLLYYTRMHQHAEMADTNAHAVPIQNDIAPGGNRATLTLADGRKITLDSARKGQLADQFGTRITKNNDGTIAYDAAQGSSTAIATNTLSTPRGGTYELALPDGSRAWLNAASSITFPVAFTGNTRDVSITGEVYFEVAKNKSKPFIVQAPSRDQADPLKVEVLGTHFNINSYPEESSVATTLLKGKVRIKNVHTSLLLKPGQQAQLRNNQLLLAAPPDLDQVMAWKNGRFDFHHVSFEEGMRLLSRWYDVEIVYENGTIPNKQLAGTMGRDLALSDVIKALEAVGIPLRLEGRKIIVKG